MLLQPIRTSADQDVTKEITHYRTPQGCQQHAHTNSLSPYIFLIQVNLP